MYYITTKDLNVGDTAYAVHRSRAKTVCRSGTVTKKTATGQVVVALAAEGEVDGTYDVRFSANGDEHGKRGSHAGGFRLYAKAAYISVVADVRKNKELRAKHQAAMDPARALLAALGPDTHTPDMAKVWAEFDRLRTALEAF